MRSLVFFIIAVLVMAAGIYMIFPKYRLQAVSQGVVKYDMITGRSWRLNLSEGIWYEMSSCGIAAAQEAEGK